MRRTLTLLVLAAVGASAAAAAPAKLPPLDPAQKACAIRTLGKKAFARHAAARAPLPAQVRARLAPCLRKKTTPRPAPSAPPSCSTSALSHPPVDLSLVTSVGPPGQVRGGSYKGHGYFRLASNDAAVSLPAAATLYEGSRYVEAGEVQYLLYFRTTCGLVLVFDHVLQPSAAVLAAFAGKPEPQPHDSRTYALPPTALPAGARVADAVGFRGLGNASVDFGVYDLARPNAASQAPDFRGNRSTWRDANALCWFDLFGADAGARIRSLAGVGSVEGAASDVCR